MLRFLPLAALVCWIAGAGFAARAQTLSAAGCPTFHCEPAALGIVTQPLVGSVLTTVTNRSLGLLPYQGCSGDGSILACLFLTDQASGAARGTLKVLSATTLQPLWGSLGVTGSYNPNARTASSGQVPTLFANGTLTAGDGSAQALYNTSTGVAIAKVKLASANVNLGLTLLSSGHGAVSQTDATITLINLSTWTKVQSIKLTDPDTGDPLKLVSPSTGNNVLYAIAYNGLTGSGYLFSLKLTTKAGLVIGSVFPFLGSSGASPVVVAPAVSGLSGNLVLIHAPGLPGDNPLQNRWIAVLDVTGRGLSQAWALPISATVQVSPTVDQTTQTLFYQLANDPSLYQANLLTGLPGTSYNMQAIGGFQVSGSGIFSLNGHLGASQSDGAFTLLMGGRYAAGNGTGAQYVFTFQPELNPTALVWSSTVLTVPANYMAAWNFAPSTQSGVYCPIGIADTSTATALVRLCDF